MASVFAAYAHIKLYEVWHYWGLYEEIAYVCSVRLQPYYHEACLSLLHNFRCSNFLSLYYNMQILTSINVDSSSAPSSDTIHFAFTMISSYFGCLFFSIPENVDFRTPDCIGAVSENHLTQFTLHPIPMFNSLLLGWMVC